MTARRLPRSVSVLLASAVLWGVPVAGAQARCYHPNYPPQGSPGSPSTNPEQNRSGSQRASSSEPPATPEHCFRKYAEHCDRARRASAGHDEE